jgi:hypothetical protein
MTKAKDMTDIFRTPGSEKDGKARRTDDAAWAIIDAESEKRDAKTARLRALDWQRKRMLWPRRQRGRQSEVVERSSWH